MNKTLKNVAWDSIIYGLGNASSKVLAFLLIPIYTRYLTTEDYGVLSSVLILYPLLADNVNLGIIPAFFRFYFTKKSNHDNEWVTSNAFVFNLLSSAAFFLTSSDPKPTICAPSANWTIPL